MGLTASPRCELICVYFNLTTEEAATGLTKHEHVKIDHSLKRWLLDQTVSFKAAAERCGKCEFFTYFLIMQSK